MPPTKCKSTSAPETARLIFRHIRSAENLQFLRRLPGFELKRELPVQMRALLDRLHDTETTGRGRTRQQ